MAETDLIKNAVLDGIQTLVALHLEGAPGVETVGATAHVWINIVKNWNLQNTLADSRRVHVAFEQLAGAVTRWPAPSQLRNYLPAPVKPVETALLPYPPDKLRRNRAMIRGLLTTLGDTLDTTKPVSETARARRKLAKQTEAVKKIVARRKP